MKFGNIIDQIMAKGVKVQISHRSDADVSAPIQEVKPVVEKQPEPVLEVKKEVASVDLKLTPVPAPTFKLPRVRRAVAPIDSGHRIFSTEEREAFRLQKAQVWEAVEAYGRDIVASMMDVVQELVSYEHAQEDEQVEFAPRIDYLDTWLDEQFNNDPEYQECRKLAVRAYVDARIKTLPTPVRRGDIEKNILRAVQVGFIVPDEKGVYSLYSKRFNLGTEYLGDKSSEEVIKNLLSQIGSAAERSKNRWVAERLEAEAKLNELLGGNSPVTFDEFDAGIEGKLTLPNGLLSLEVPDGKDGERYFPGGYMIVRLDDGKVRPVYGTGYLSRTVQELSNAGTFVWAHQLRNERVEKINSNVPKEGAAQIYKLHRNIRRGLVRGREQRQQVADYLAAQQAKNEKTVARVARKDEFNDKVRAEKQAYLASQTATPHENFVEGKPGRTYFRYGKQGPFVQQLPNGKEREWWGVHGIVVRGQNGEISGVEYPERLKELFERSVKKLPVKPGDNFEKLEWPLRPLLRMGKVHAEYLATNSTVRVATTEPDNESGQAEVSVAEVPATE